MKKYLPLLLILMSLTLHSTEDSLRSSYGFYGNLLLNMHIADFNRIPDCPSCSPGFRSGFGIGPAFGLLYEYPLSKSYSIGGRLSYQDISGLLKENETTTVIVNSESVVGEFEHSMDATISIFGLEPYFLYNLSDRLSVSLGLQIGTILTKEYSQKEEIVKPSNTGTFVDENGNDTFSRTRNEFSGELEKAASLYFAPVLGASYKFPLNNKGTWNVFPEAFYLLGLSNIVDDPLVKQWAVHSFRLGVSIKYTPEYKKEKIKKFEKFEQIDTIYIENDLITSLQYKLGQEKSQTSKVEDDDFITETLNITRIDTVFKPKEYIVKSKISAVGLTDALDEVATPKFVIEEFSIARLQPLLNYIFFDSLSSEINSRYTKLSAIEVKNFSVDSLYDSDVISTYRHVLNIIGKRLKDNPGSSITLIGCNDGNVEKNNLSLSEERANSIKNYLINIWEIETNRIKIKAGNLPVKASTPLTDFEKAQENRRVEFISDNPEITKPVFASYNIRTTSIPGIRFKPQISAPAGLKKWSISIKQDNKILKTFDFGNDMKSTVDWILADDNRSIPVLDKPLEYTLEAIDERGNKGTSQTGQIEIEQITVQKKRESGLVDKQIDNYSLILFDFDKADLSSSNREIINFVKSRLHRDSKVEIIGYTDKTGDSEHNKRLSERRASSVANDLKHPGSTWKGVGKEVLLFDNDYPEGRFYCRTINIKVEREIK